MTDALKQARDALPPLPEPAGVGMLIDYRWEGAPSLDPRAAHPHVSVSVPAYTADQMREYARAAIARADAAQAAPVAWCYLTPAGKIGYFEGKPMVMPGPVGNEHHTTPLYAGAPPAPAAQEPAQEPAQTSDVPSDQVIALAEALQVRRILEEIKAVALIHPAADIPTPFQAAWQQCCEEIFYRATGDQWHMDEDTPECRALSRLKASNDAQQEPAQADAREALTDEQLLAIARDEAGGNTIKLTRDVGPYEVTEVTHVYRCIARAIERAHGIGQAKPAGGAP